MKCQLGCFNRPWREHPIEEAFKGILKTGFEYVGFMRHKIDGVNKPPVSAESTPEEVDYWVNKVKSTGLKLATFSDHGTMSFKLIDYAKQAGIKYLLRSGKPYSEKLKEFAAYAEEKGIVIMMKPHKPHAPDGRACLEVVKKINSPSYKICYDPSNAIKGSGVDPASEIWDIAEEVAGLCIKDYKDGSNEVTPGDGDVDFESIFKALNKAGFTGPALIETMALGSGSIEDINSECKRAYDYLTGIISDLN